MKRAAVLVACLALTLSACSGNDSDNSTTTEDTEVTYSPPELTAYEEQFLAQLGKYASVDDEDALNLAYDGCAFMEDGYLMGQLTIPPSPIQQNLEIYPSVSSREVHSILSLAITNLCPWNAKERFTP